MRRRAAIVLGLLLAGGSMSIQPAFAARHHAPDTVRVTVYVGNGNGREPYTIGAQGLVLDTETLILTEGDETSESFSSSGVFVSDTICSDTISHTIYLVDNMTYDASDIYIEMPFERGGFLDEFIKRHPIHLPFNARPAESFPMTFFSDIPVFFIVWIFGFSLAVYLLRLLFRSMAGTQSVDALVNLPEEKILEHDSSVLSSFCKQYPNHPAVKTVSMELGRRFYKEMAYKKASAFFERAIKTDRSAKNPEAHYYLGHCLRHMDFLCDAIDEWMASYMDDPQGPFATDAWREAQRWRAHQIVHDKEECPACGTDCRLTDMSCRACGAKLKRTLVHCGVCGKMMIKEAQVCIHCLPDDVKAEVAAGGWPILKTTYLDWEAELIKSRLTTADIPCVLTGEKGSAIPVQVGHLGEIHIRVPVSDLAEAQSLVSQSPAG